MLYYTSLLIITNAIHSSVACWYSAEYALICLLGASVLQHAKYYDTYPGKKVVYLCDIALTHYIFLRGNWEAYQIYQIVGMTSGMCLHYILSMFSTCIAIYSFYLWEHFDSSGRSWRPFHCIFHISGSVAGHLLLTEYRRAYPDKCLCGSGN